MDERAFQAATFPREPFNESTGAMLAGRTQKIPSGRSAGIGGICDEQARERLRNDGARKLGGLAKVKVHISGVA